MTERSSHRRAAPAPRSAARADDPKAKPGAPKVLASDPDPKPSKSASVPAKAAPAKKEA